MTLEVALLQLFYQQKTFIDLTLVISADVRHTEQNCCSIELMIYMSGKSKFVTSVSESASQEMSN